MGQLPVVIRRGVLALCAFLLLTLLWMVVVPLPARMAYAGSSVILFGDGTPAHVFLSTDDKWRIPVNLSEIDPDYLDALTHLEDRRFRYHPGVDPIAILRAAAANLSHGHIVSGGSTLTMQLVRVLEPRPRTFSSKVIEAFRALQLELHFSKDEILEAYLQFIPFGRNVEGVEAASLSYFGHLAKDLTPAEICTLLAVPQNPNRRYPAPGHENTLTTARDKLAQRLAYDDRLPRGGDDARSTVEDMLKQVKATPVPAELRPFPRLAAHAAVWLRQRYPHLPRITTTLDGGVQRLTERLMTAAGRQVLSRGIHNGVAVVVDHKTAQIRGLVGNFDFWDADHGGQIAGFDVPRSVGSTLKPFVYASAIDKGLALPDFLVADIPMQFGTWTPKNFDGDYQGLVRLEEALSRSLNIPFIGLLHKLGVETFVGILQTMGAHTLNTTPGHYGLTAVVGGIELSPLEVTTFYTTLAQNGAYRPLTLLAPESLPPTVQVFTPGAAWLTRQALAIRDRPDFPARRSLTATPAAIHWKTGTSFGHRDAWALGSGPVYTAGIWMGNFDGSPTVELVGAEVAAPVLFDLLEGLGRQVRTPLNNLPPPDLTQVEVCTYSGHIPGDACPATRKVLAPRTSVPTDRCPYHQRIDIDRKTGMALTPDCRAGHRWESVIFTVWPTRVRRWMMDQSRSLPQPPTWAPECRTGGVDQPPTIVSPPEGQISILIPGMKATDQEVPLEAEAHGRGGTLSWFVDGTFLGTAEADERLWWIPAAGKHEIVVMDEGGLSSRRVLEVRGGG